MTSWRSTLINILLGSTSAACLGEWTEGGCAEVGWLVSPVYLRICKKERDRPLLAGRASFLMGIWTVDAGYASPGAGEQSATLGRNREGERWGERQRNTQAKT